MRELSKLYFGKPRRGQGGHEGQKATRDKGPGGHEGQRARVVLVENLIFSKKYPQSKSADPRHWGSVTLVYNRVESFKLKMTHCG